MRIKNSWVKKSKRAKSRIRERRKRFVKKIGRLFLAALFLAGVAFGINRIRHFAMTSSHFQIDKIKFSGLVSLERKELGRIAGIELGDNIFNISLREIARRLEAHPVIRSAVVRRVLPRKVFITIEERTAVASIEYRDRLYLIDCEGFIFSLNSLPEELPHIAGVDDVKTKRGNQLRSDRLQSALAIVENTSIPVSEIDLSGRHLLLKTGGVKIFLKEDVREETLLDVALIISDIEQRGEKAEYIDMRFANPVVKLR